MQKIDAIDDEIDYFKIILCKCNTQDWILEIRPDYSDMPKKIRHCGLLPKFLDEIYDRMNEERDALAKGTGGDMSKKYVIELEDLSFVNGSSYKKDILYRVKGFNSLVFDQNGLDKLEKFDLDYIKSHLDLGILQESAYKKGYEDGLKVGQTVTIKSVSKEYTSSPSASVSFSRAGEASCENCLCEVYEALERFKDQFRPKDAEDNPIRVGDEVVSINGDGEPIEGLLPWVVTKEIANLYVGMEAGGALRSSNKKRVRKTGRHFDTMNKLLEEMKA